MTSRSSSRAWGDLPEGPPSAPLSVELRPGLVLGGKYHLLRHIGMGGMGDVWVARNASTGADVAVKMLLPQRALSPDSLERFRREAHATASLTHRAIVRVFDLLELDRDQGSLLMVMELLRGHTLADKIHQQQRLAVDETLDVVFPILSALDHAHGRGLVHRDLKPENIFLAFEPDGQIMPKVLDFGISKMRNPQVDAITGDGELVGTPCYMSPEQAVGRASVDARSDIFSVGILLYEMLSGENPFLADGVHAVIMSILERDPEPIEGIPPALWAVIARAMSKKPEERYETTAELAEALRQAVPTYASSMHISAPFRATVSPTSIHVQPTIASSPSLDHAVAVAPISLPSRRWTTAATFAGGAMLLLVGAFAGSMRTSGRPSAVGTEETVRAQTVKELARSEHTVLVSYSASGVASAVEHPMIAAVVPSPTSSSPLSPITMAASDVVPTVVSPTAQPLIRRHHQAVQVVRDPGF